MTLVLAVISFFLVAILAITFYLYIKISEKKLAIQDEAESMILDKIYEAIIQTDKNFVVTRWNRRAEHIFGWSAEEVIGKNIGDFVKVTTVTNGWIISESLKHMGQIFPTSHNLPNLAKKY